MIRPAGEADLPLILDMGAKFHAAAKPGGVFCAETFGEFCRHLIREDHGCLFVSERGMIGGFAWPLPFSANHLIAMDAFWWAEDGRGMALLRALEDWAEARGAELRIGFVGLRPGSVERALNRRGYRRLEVIMVKNNAR